MKVARYRDYGGPEMIEVGEQADARAPKGSLLVAVHATSVNPVDWKIAKGDFPFDILEPRLPYIPGADMAGVVVTAAPGFEAGQRVFARKPGINIGGATAELASCAPFAAAVIPDGMSFEEAAAIPLAATTALIGLRDEARLPMTGAEGTRVLVIGASGGVGHFGVQIAKAAGAHVTGVSSGANLHLVASLGADEVLDYTKTEVFNAGGDFDVILDCVGNDPVGRFTPWLTPRGTYASTLPTAATFARQMLSAVTGGKRVRAVMLKPSGDDLRFLCELWAQKKLQPHIEEVFPLARTADAYRRSISGRARGKLVIRVRGPIGQRT